MQKTADDADDIFHSSEILLVIASVSERSEDANQEDSYVGSDRLKKQ